MMNPLLSPLILLLVGHVALVQSAPNVVIILADDLGLHDIGYNNPKIRTPHLDRLANTGRKFTHSYMQSSCTPSRAALLTGKYPHTMKIEMAFQPATAHCLPTDIKLLPEYLKDQNYSTHIVGKWHLGFCQQACLPNQRGFDTFDGFYAGLGDYYNHTDAEGFRKYDWHSNNTLDKSVFGEYVTELITDKAEEILANHDPDIPFFLYVSHLAPHVPLQAPDKFVHMYSHIADPRRRTYMAQVTALDHEIGRLVSALKVHNHYDNTVIFFSSDNGGEGFAGPSDNHPLRGTKATLWEGGSRVSSFVHGKGVENTGDEHDGLLHVTDWFTSILSMAGVDPADYASQNADGLDQTGMILRGENSTRNEMVYNINNKPVSIVGHNALRYNDYKLIWGFTGIADGYGRNIFLSIDPDNDIIPPLDPADDIVSPYARFFSPDFLQAVVPASFSARVIGNDLDSGTVHLYNLVDDEEERFDLANDTAYASILTDLKWRILNHTANIVPFGNVPPRPTQALAALVDDGWSTGWCEDLTITLT